VTAPNPAPTGVYRVGQAEFIALIAFLSALNAIAIDVMLPAFGAVREAFSLQPDATEVSLIVTAYLAGMGLGQYVYGPIADAYGRKPVLYVGVLLYLLGATGAILSPSLEAMIVFRFLWGIGAAGPRVVSIAIVRDRYSGDDMARVLAIVMAVFMIIPAIAPSIGQAALALGSWRYPFVFSAGFALLLGVWSIRLRETLPPGDRMPLNTRTTVAATREVFRHRRTTGMMIALTFAMGAFFPYLGSGQLIYEQIYDRADQYAYWFGLAAVVMAIGSVTNSRLVKRIGTEAMLTRTLMSYVITAAVFVAVAFATQGTPPFPVFYILTTMLIVGHVVNGALLNSLAMEDVGHVAGTAAAVIGTVTTVGGSLLGSLVDRAIADSVEPFSLGFLVFGLAMVAAVVSARRAGSGAPQVSTPRQPV
jgi:DHA1 family bicyclomycin/chloramphenicol resistance-like MFS transporter